jgi:DNA-binding transcriptional regulator YhcF (GntR family)
MLKGWIKLHRKLLDSEIFYDAELLKVFVWCILKANRKPKEVNGIKIKTGQFISGRLSASEELYIKPSTVYTRLQKLKALKFISIKSTTKFSIITVLKYKNYQQIDEQPKVTIEKRLDKFVLEVTTFQLQNNYSEDMIDNFISYWTEPNKSNTKMRFEIQKTFEIGRRLVNWNKNSKKFEKTEKKNIIDTWQEARNIINNGR